MGIVYIAAAISIVLLAVAGWAVLKTALDSVKDRFR